MSCAHRWSVSIGEGAEPQTRCILCNESKNIDEARQKNCAPQQSRASLSGSVENLERELTELKLHIDQIKIYRTRARVIEKALKILRSL
jgi:hypothetical protein